MRCIKKTVRVYCHTLHGRYPEAEIPWGDYWIDVAKRKRRGSRWTRLAPCVCGRDNFDGDLEFQEEWRDHCVNGTPLRYSKGQHEWTDEEAVEYANWQRMKAEFDGGTMFTEDHDEVINNVYVNKPSLVRADVETALEWLIRRRGLVSPGVALRFRWVKPSIMCRQG